MSAVAVCRVKNGNGACIKRKKRQELETENWASGRPLDTRAVVLAKKKYPHSEFKERTGNPPSLNYDHQAGFHTERRSRKKKI
jgi:hypothetical protein